MISAMNSQAHQNFENLLRAVVSVPASIIKADIAAERMEREQAQEDGKAQERVRPIVSPALVSSSTLGTS
jgi:hypothetical protein